MAGVKISDDVAFPPIALGDLDGTENIALQVGAANAKTSIAAAASYKTRVTVTASTYTVQPEDDVVEINTGTCTVTLPALSTQQKPIKIIKISSSAGLVTIQRAGSDVISASSFTAVYMELNGEFYDFSPLSARWDVTAKKATRTVTANATIALEDTLFVNTATATISTPANLTGEWEVQKITDSAGTVTINAPAGATYTRAALSSVTLTSDGDRWRFKPITSTRIDLVDGYESGSNANGSYYKKPSGEMVQRRASSLPTTTIQANLFGSSSGNAYVNSGGTLFTFPIQFATIDKVVVSSFSDISNYVLFAEPRSITTSQCNILAAATASQTSSISYEATGRWYA